MRPLLLLAFFISTNAFAHDDFPTEKQIIEWLNKGAAQAEIYSHDKTDIKTIYLQDHEKAYLVSVALRNEGRNGMFRTALIRPAIQEARVLPSYIKNVEAVYDLSDDMISELVALEIYSGQGTMEGTKSLVNLNGWEPVVLLERKIRSSSGAYRSDDRRYYDEQCIWEFKGSEKNTKLELFEQCMYTKGGKNASTNNIKKRFSFIDGKLREVTDSSAVR